MEWRVVDLERSVTAVRRSLRLSPARIVTYSGLMSFRPTKRGSDSLSVDESTSLDELLKTLARRHTSGRVSCRAIDLLRQ
jgi:hypothetical protein